MNQINPIHLIVLMVTILLFSLYSLGGEKERLSDEKASFIQSEQLAINLNSVKSLYANKKKTQKDLNRILSLSTLKSEKIDVKRSKSSINISSQSISSTALNTLMGKIVNGAYNVTKLKIKKLSEEKVSINMEIKW